MQNVSQIRCDDFFFFGSFSALEIYRSSQIAELSVTAKSEFDTVFKEKSYKASKQRDSAKARLSRSLISTSEVSELLSTQRRIRYLIEHKRALVESSTSLRSSVNADARKGFKILLLEVSCSSVYVFRISATN